MKYFLKRVVETLLFIPALVLALGHAILELLED